ncbi:hypothetical protein SXANM310S_06221 [Streptomyces xanthochromogenes]
MPPPPVAHPSAPAAPSGSRRRPPSAAETVRTNRSVNTEPLWSATARPPAEAAGDVVRWAAFSCVLVPVVLVVYGSSFAGATGSALGLMAVTTVCRLLLRQSERAAAEERAMRSFPAPARRGRAASSGHRGGRHGGGCTPEG